MADKNNVVYEEENQRNVTTQFDLMSLHMCLSPADFTLQLIICSNSP